MKLSVKNFLNETELLIQNGKSRKVREKFAKLTLETIPRSSVLPIAALARRANLPQIALNILHPIVRRNEGSASVLEQAEYAAALSFIGAGNEALAILKPLPIEKSPSLLLYMAFALFNQWDYETAIPLLKRYCKSDGLLPYQRMTGQLNLAAALINEDHLEEAKSILLSLKETCEKNQHFLLLGNTYELLAQIAILQNFYSTAESHLFNAEHFLSETGGTYLLFVKKWKAICHLRSRTNDSNLLEVLEPLRKIKLEAIERRQWETVRDCDRHEAITLKNDKLFLNVLFGTPYEAYRTKLLKAYPRTIKIPDHYFNNLQPAFEPTTTVDVRSGEVASRTARDSSVKIVALLSEKPSLLKCLQSLAEDFYKPIRLPSLFEKIYHEEHYEPGRSSEKAYRCIVQLRQWLVEHSVPLEIKEKSTFYQLYSKYPLALRSYLPSVKHKNKTAA